MTVNKGEVQLAHATGDVEGAGVAVGTLWVAPLVQVVNMSSAAAESAPPPRTQPNPRVRRVPRDAPDEARRPSELRSRLVQNGAALGRGDPAAGEENSVCRWATLWGDGRRLDARILAGLGSSSPRRSPRRSR